MNGEDILFAMTSLGFENYGEALKIYLARYREVSRRPSPSEPSLPPFHFRMWSTNAAQNLVARGEHPKPLASGSAGAGAASPPYDNTNHNVLSNPMESSADSTADFGYPGGHGGAGEY